MKKFLSCFLVALLLASSLAVTASAATAPNITPRSGWNYLDFTLTPGSPAARTPVVNANKGFVNCTNSTSSPISCYAGVEAYTSGSWLLYGSSLIPNDGIPHGSSMVEFPNDLSTRGVIGSSSAVCKASGTYGFYL